MKGVYPVAVSCHVLQVSSSGYFRWKHSRGEAPRRCRDALVLTHIRAIHAQVKGEYGWPRMQKQLQAQGLHIGKERVRKRPVGMRPRIQALPSVAKGPNQRWATDLCRIWTGRDGWASLALVIF